MEDILVKGDTIELEFTADIDITGYKIRCEIYDNEGQSIKLATLNSGGADTQILITDATNGVFDIMAAKALSTDFEDASFIEIEFEDTTGKVYTIYQGNIIFKSEKITWTTP